MSGLAGFWNRGSGFQWHHWIFPLCLRAVRVVFGDKL